MIDDQEMLVFQPCFITKHLDVSFTEFPWNTFEKHPKKLVQSGLRAKSDFLKLVGKFTLANGSDHEGRLLEITAGHRTEHVFLVSNNHLRVS